MKVNTRREMLYRMILEWRGRSCFQDLREHRMTHVHADQRGHPYAGPRLTTMMPMIQYLTASTSSPPFQQSNVPRRNDQRGTKLGDSSEVSQDRCAGWAGVALTHSRY